MSTIRTVSCYLVIERDQRNSISLFPRISRMTKDKPALRTGQIAVKVNLKVPTSLFDQFIPQVEATITEPDVIVPSIELEPEVN